MRCGSTWICDLIASLFGTSWIFWEKGRDIPQKRFKDEIEKEPRKSVQVIKMHYTPPERICECITPSDKNNFVISITRDLRDIAISKILYIRYNEGARSIARLKQLEDIRREFNNDKMPDRRYINVFVQSPHFNHIENAWRMYNNGYKHPNYFLLNYEDLNSKRRLFWMQKICEFLGIHRDPQQLRTVIQRNNFQNKTGRTQGTGPNNAFRRKGIVGDYANWLNPRSLEKLNKIINSVKKDEEMIINIPEIIPKDSIEYLKDALIEKRLIYYDNITHEYKLNREIYNKL